ncbi:hypothetical protein SLE2022_181500 [Rubroshorea leprosula]
MLRAGLKCDLGNSMLLQPFVSLLNGLESRLNLGMNNQTIRTDFGLLEDIAESLAVYARQPNTANRGRISNLEVSWCRTSIIRPTRNCCSTEIGHGKAAPIRKTPSWMT